MSKQGKDTHQNLIIRKTIAVNASPEVVFKAITIPEELTNWFFDEATFKPIVGSKVQFITLRKTSRI